MRWTAEGKNVGDKVAYYPFRLSDTLRIGVIVGETPTRWKIDDGRMLTKDTGRFVGGKHRYAFDADDEVEKRMQRDIEDQILAARKRKIREFVDGRPVREVVSLLWPIVGPLIEGEKA